MIERAMVGKYQVRARADEDARGRNLEALRHQTVGFFEEGFRIDHHPIAEHTGLAGMNDAGGNQMEHKRAVTYKDGMSCVVPALIANDDVEALGQQIDNLAFAFIAPLGADYDDDF